MAKIKIETGIYRHYKGGEYEVRGVVQHSETLEAMVHYKHLDDGSEWVRPYSMFFEQVNINGKSVSRFEKIDD